MDGDINHGLKWSAVSVIAVRAVSAIRSVVIARVVGPEAVGSFAAAFAFVSLASLVAEFGLQSYLVQRGRHAPAEAFPVGQIAVFMASIASVVLLVSAGSIAGFYGNDEVTALVAVLTVSVFLTGLTVVPGALLRADLRFDVIGRVAVAAEATSCVVGITAAVMGAEVWALVASALTSQIVTLALLLVARPTWTRADPESRSTARRSALRFGMSLATGSAVWALALQGDNVIVGRVLGASALGVYAFAYNYGVLPGGLIGSTVSDVALAGLSKEQTDASRAELFTKFIRVGNAAAAPLVAIAIALAPAAVRFVLGPEWTGAIRPLQVLLVVGWVRGVLPIEALLRSKARVSAELKVGIVAAPATIAAAYVGAQGTITTVALTVGAVLIAGSMAGTWLAVRAINERLVIVVRAATPAIGIAMFCALPLLVNEAVHVAPDAVALFVGGPVCVAMAVAGVRRRLPDEWEWLRDIAGSKRQAAQT